MQHPCDSPSIQGRSAPSAGTRRDERLPRRDVESRSLNSQQAARSADEDAARSTGSPSPIGPTEQPSKVPSLQWSSYFSTKDQAFAHSCSIDRSSTPARRRRGTKSRTTPA